MYMYKYNQRRRPPDHPVCLLFSIGIAASDGASVDFFARARVLLVILLLASLQVLVLDVLPLALWEPR